MLGGKRKGSGLLLLALLGFAPARAMTILVTYQSSVPAAAQTAFNQIVATYDQMFINPATVTIDVAFSSTLASNVLAESGTVRGTTPYANWLGQLQAGSTANPQNAYLAAGLDSLPATDPMLANNGSGNVLLTFANALALGYTVSPVRFDSTLTFSTAATFEYNQVATPGAYDFIDVAEHELDEALGIDSALTGLTNGAAIPANTNFAGEDYFRYSGVGTRSITTTANPANPVYFSFDGGKTNVAVFNQNNSFGDRNDWIYGDTGCPATAPGPYIQDAVTCPNEVVLLSANSPEVKVLQTLGWDVAIPEPGTVELLLVGIAAIGCYQARRVRRRS
jgi:PEP-CTERM motif-containing protein